MKALWGFVMVIVFAAAALGVLALVASLVLGAIGTAFAPALGGFLSVVYWAFVLAVAVTGYFAIATQWRRRAWGWLTIAGAVIVFAAINFYAYGAYRMTSPNTGDTLTAMLCLAALGFVASRGMNSDDSATTRQ